MIEPLETRIAPAAIAVTYTDIDGDLVKITASKPGPAAPPLDAGDLIFVGGGTSGQLAGLNLLEAAFDGAKIVFTVTKKPGGDGLAHVGFVNAIGFDLDQVIVKGDLGKIVGGDATTANDPGLNLLQVRTMGTLGLVTQGGAGSLDSNITGRLGALKVAGDFTAAFLRVFAATAADAQLGSLFIGGDLTGSAGNSGRVESFGAMGDVRIGGNLTGGGMSSGTVQSFAAMGDVWIGSDLTGGVGIASGRVVSSGSMGDVRIGGDIIGGAGDSASGTVSSSGSMGDVRIGGDVVGGVGNTSGRVLSIGAMGDVQIGGDVTGGAGIGSGQIESFSGAMGDVRIGGDVTGGAGDESGRISSDGAMGQVRIGGDIAGGAGVNSGQVLGAGGMGRVQIGGSIAGGAGLSSGVVFSSIAMGSVQIGGDLIGGTGGASGRIATSGSMGHLRMAGDLIGGSIAGMDSLTDSGVIFAAGRIASVTLGGSLIAGSDRSFAGTLTRCGAIVAGDDLGPVKIGGSILGNSTNPALIIAKGQDAKPASGFDVAIASLAVKGDVRFAKILAGFNANQTPVNADAAIGAVTVGRDWAASSLVAGAEDTGADGFGINDSLQTAGNTGLIARIASITIKGDATGSLAAGDNFGFVAQQIDKLKIGSRTFTLAPGLSSPTDNFLLPFTDDVHLLEV